MTVSDPHPPLADDAQASLRTELLGQIAAAQFDLEAVIADLTRDGASSSALADSRSQLGALTALSRQMSNASPAALADMRAEIVSMVATSQSTAQQARSAAVGKADAAELISRAQEARAHVDEVMRGMKDFDPYLRFEHEREEAEYHRREAERRAYIAAEQAKGTPQGDLNASGAAVGQMADAAAHGASDSPEFRKRWDELVASIEKLRDAAKANGVSTEEFDRHLREDLRRILKSKGLSNAQIDAQFAAHSDPLDAVKAYVGNNDVDAIAVKAEERKHDALLAGLTQAQSAPANTVTPSIPIADAMATLRAAGVVAQTHDSDNGPDHGVTTQVAQASTPSRFA